MLKPSVRQEESSFSITVYPSSVKQRRAAMTVGLILVLAVGVVLPYAKVAGSQVQAFLPAFLTGVFFSEVLTAYLILSEFQVTRSISLPFLAGAYLYNALIVIPHALTFPGIFSAAGLLGAGTQTATWLWVFWHGGFPLLIGLYAVVERRFGHKQASRKQAIGLMTGTVGGALLLVSILTWISISGEAWLPRIIQKDNFHILITSGVGPVVWVVNLAALGMLLFQMRGRTVIQLWLTVALLASLLDVTLTLFSGSRYSLGWYAARLTSILSATFVLGTLLYEIRRLYYRIVRQERIFRTVFEFAAVGIARIDLTRRPIEVNRAMEKILGYPEEDLCRMNVADLTYPEDLTKEQELLQELKKGTRDHFQVEKRYFHKNGGLVWGNSIVSVVRGVNDEPEFFIGMVEDITRRKEYEKQITYQAFHDALTGLPNRALFSDRLQLALIQAKRTSRKLGVLFLDLDGFKAVNDEHGHEAGDQLLQEVADRLAGTVRSGDTVARLGGDEFIVLLPDIAERMDAETVAEKIREQVSAPFALEVSMAYVSTSIGMALYPYHGDEAQDLIKHADLAMYRAKQLGKNRWCFFEGKQTSLGG